MADALVVDNGSYMLKAGFAGDDAPLVLTRTIVGRPSDPSVMAEADRKDSFIGDEAHDKREILSINHPIEHGIITNWDDMEKIWHHAFYNELKVNPQEHPILLSECPLNSNENREKMAEIMFETMKAPALSIEMSAKLVLYGNGCFSGIVAESGDGTSNVVPIYESKVLPNAIFRYDVTGQSLTNYLIKTFAGKGLEFKTYAQKTIVHDIKEKLCYVAQDFNQEETKAKADGSLEKSYELPDGRSITLGKERIECCEAFFQPSLLGIKSDGIHKIVHDSIMKCDVDMQDELFTQIIMSGGNTMFSGMHDRMYKEVKALVPKTKVKVLCPPERKYSAWIGGSVAASLSSFEENTLTKEKYQECGKSAIHRV